MLHRYLIFLDCGSVDCYSMENSFFVLLGVVAISAKVGYLIVPKCGPIEGGVKLYVIVEKEELPVALAAQDSSLSPRSLLLVNSTFRLKVASSNYHASISSGESSSLDGVYEDGEMLL